jgi:hypothetical protein
LVVRFGAASQLLGSFPAISRGLRAFRCALCAEKGRAIMSAVPGQPRAVTEFLNHATPEEMRIYTVALQHLAMLMRPGDSAGGPATETVPGTLRLLEFYEGVYLEARSRNSWKTDVQMRCSIRRFKELVGDLAIKDICDEHIDTFKRKRRPCAVPTLNKDLRNLRAILNLAVRRKYRATPLYIEMERECLDTKPAWSFEEVRRILASARQAKGKICDIVAADWWEALLLFILNTGLRIDTVMRTPRDHFDPQTQVVRIPAALQKHKKEHAQVLHPSVAAAIVRLSKTSRPLRKWLFPWPIKSDGHRKSWQKLEVHYRKILVRAGLPATRTDLFHKLRRTNATFITAASSEEVARNQLGHSALSVTRRYIDRTKVTLRTGTDLLPWEQLALPAPELPEVERIVDYDAVRVNGHKLGEIRYLVAFEPIDRERFPNSLLSCEYTMTATKDEACAIVRDRFHWAVFHDCDKTGLGNKSRFVTGAWPSPMDFDADLEAGTDGRTVATIFDWDRCCAEKDARKQS